MKRGAFTHTMRTFILSPPAHTDQQKPGGYQQAARERRPRPAGNAQKQQQQPQADQRHADNAGRVSALPVRPFRRAAASSLMHPSSPVSLAGYAAGAPDMTAFPRIFHDFPTVVYILSIYFPPQIVYNK